MARTLEEKYTEAIHVAVQLNFAIGEIENAIDPISLNDAVDLIPDKVFNKLQREIHDFLMHDITRAELLVVLNEQLKSRKKSLKRYMRLCGKS